MFIKARLHIIPGMRLIGIAKERPLDEQNTLARYLPSWEHAIPTHKLVLMVFMLLTGFTSASLSLMALAQQTSMPLDRFVAYADILPGQPASAVEGRGLSCHVNTHNYYGLEGDVGCVLDHEASFLVQVNISGGIIQQTNFVMRDDALRLGNLALLMGAPYPHDLRSTVGFSWRGKSVLAWVDAGQHSLFRQASKVTFTNYS